MSLSAWLIFGILILLYILSLVANRLSFSKKYRGNIGEALTEEVLESKNYFGWIFGRKNDSYWTATLPAGIGRSIKNKFYNPS